MQAVSGEHPVLTTHSIINPALKNHQQQQPQRISKVSWARCQQQQRRHLFILVITSNNTPHNQHIKVQNLKKKKFFFSLGKKKWEIKQTTTKNGQKTRVKNQRRVNGESSLRYQSFLFFVYNCFINILNIPPKDPKLIRASKAKARERTFSCARGYRATIFATR